MINILDWPDHKAPHVSEMDTITRYTPKFPNRQHTAPTAITLKLSALAVVMR